VPRRRRSSTVSLPPPAAARRAGGGPRGGAPRSAPSLAGRWLLPHRRWRSACSRARRTRTCSVSTACVTSSRTSCGSRGSARQRFRSPRSSGGRRSRAPEGSARRWPRRRRASAVTGTTRSEAGGAPTPSALSRSPRRREARRPAPKMRIRLRWRLMVTRSWPCCFAVQSSRPYDPPRAPGPAWCRECAHAPVAGEQSACQPSAHGSNATERHGGSGPPCSRPSAGPRSAPQC
jgi:hypothetical protein